MYHHYEILSQAQDDKHFNHDAGPSVRLGQRTIEFGTPIIWGAGVGVEGSLDLQRFFDFVPLMRDCAQNDNLLS